jgi:hypothetical protein
MIEKVTYGLMRGGWSRSSLVGGRASPLLYSSEARVMIVGIGVIV